MNTKTKTKHRVCFANIGLLDILERNTIGLHYSSIYYIHMYIIFSGDAGAKIDTTFQNIVNAI